ncbi:hypothetical protein M3Y99_01110100 [Aphelenchoides fujianensis]|nr:hypothetical protein M3Y99_01110100 [Aphelenchoides fujianensis]
MMSSAIDRMRRGSVPGFSRMPAVRGMLLRPEDLAVAEVELDAQSLNFATIRNQLPDPTIYMFICLTADLVIWVLAGFILYKAIKSCRATKKEGLLPKNIDKYDRLESGLESDYDDTDSLLGDEYEPQWVPDAVIVVKGDGGVVKKQSVDVRTFHAPRFNIQRWHSIPNVYENHDYV